jgi:hypothetical protein
MMSPLGLVLIILALLAIGIAAVLGPPVERTPGAGPIEEVLGFAFALFVLEVIVVGLIYVVVA